MAKPKAKAVQPETATVGHNSEREQFEEQQFLNAFREVKEIKTNIALEMGDAKEVYARLKPIGFTPADVKWAFELEEKNSGDVIATMQRRIRIAKMLGHGLARQFEMFDEDRTPLEDRAYEEGLAAGKLRKDMANPYGLDSAAGQNFQRGINDGTAFANKDLSSAMDELIKGADEGDEDPFDAADPARVAAE